MCMHVKVLSLSQCTSWVRGSQELISHIKDIIWNCQSSWWWRRRRCFPSKTPWTRKKPLLLWSEKSLIGTPKNWGAALRDHFWVAAAWSKNARKWFYIIKCNNIAISGEIPRCQLSIIAGAQKLGLNLSPPPFAQWPRTLLKIMQRGTHFWQRFHPSAKRRGEGTRGESRTETAAKWCPKEEEREMLFSTLLLLLLCFPKKNSRLMLRSMCSSR